jgi:hypothetical protein
MFWAKVVDKIKTRFVFSNIFSENCAVYERMWKNMVGPQRPQMLRRMRCACWITKATNTYSEYVILIAFLRRQLLRERASVLHYTYIACIVYIM